MRTFLSEQEQIYSEQHAKELLAIQANYNKKLKQLNTELAKQKSDLMIKHMKIAQQQAAAAQLKQKTKIEPQQQVVAKTGTVDTAGNPVTSKGGTPTVESIEILRMGNKNKSLNEGMVTVIKNKLRKLKDLGQNLIDRRMKKELTPEQYQYYIDNKKEFLEMTVRKYKKQLKKQVNEATFSTQGVNDDDYFRLKDYLDAEDISYSEDEDGTEITFDETELDKEWQDQLDIMGLKSFDDDYFDEDPNTDDILSFEDENEDDDKVFYVKVEDEGEAFIGKIYKLFDEGDWRSKIIDGKSDTFEKINFDPDYDEYDIIAFLRDNYADAEVISKNEFNDHVENPELEPEIKEGIHRIPTLNQFLNEYNK